MRNLGRVVSSLLAVAAVGCGGAGSGPSSSSNRRGVENSSFTLTVRGETAVLDPSTNTTIILPGGGVVTSSAGGIDCGISGGMLHKACAAKFAYGTTGIILTAIPDTASGFQYFGFAGACGLAPCSVDMTSDRTVIVRFTKTQAGLGAHPNFTDPAVHGRAFFDSLAQLPGTYNCSISSCHGPTYGGAGIAPSCNGCHASAGWANWQQSCSFCHGQKTDLAKAGYDFNVHPDWAAPPDDVSQRLTGTSHGAAGAHQKHVNPTIPNAVRAPVPCSECHIVPETAIHSLNYELDLPFGPLSRSQGAQPTWDAATLTCGANYCHGNFAYGAIRGSAASLTWTGSLNGCQTCHGMPPAGHAFGGTANPRSCAPCHSDTVLPDGTIDLAKGRHINGQKDAAGGACDACHWFPGSATQVATGAHLAHFGLTAAQGSSGYGDLDTLEAKYPTATPTSAPAAYAFGCGNCHPIDAAQHSMVTASTVAKVWLYEASAPGSSLKARNDSTAAYEPVAKTCSGVYCHSSGQNAPTYRTTPPWTSGTHLACDGCHDNPPRYTSGGAGTATANSHLNLADDGYEFGHFDGLIGPWLYSQHGVGGSTDAAPITCQTCHAETVDPANTGPSGFYYLDTTGNYQLPGGDAGRLGTPWYQQLQCGACHAATRPTAPLQAGRTLPLRHVNGGRDVVFDPRETLPAISWLPAEPNRPVAPYWMTDAGTMWSRYGTDAVYSGTTISFSLSRATYEPATKTCSGVACHLAESPRWGTPYQYNTNGSAACYACHPNF